MYNTEYSVCEEPRCLSSSGIQQEENNGLAQHKNGFSLEEKVRAECGSASTDTADVAEVQFTTVQWFARSAWKPPEYLETTRILGNQPDTWKPAG